QTSGPSPTPSTRGTQDKDAVENRFHDEVCSGQITSSRSSARSFQLDRGALSEGIPGEGSASGAGGGRSVGASRALGASGAASARAAASLLPKTWTRAA